MDISININRDTNEKKFCEPYQNCKNESLHLGLHNFNPLYKGNLTKINPRPGKNANGCFKDKGMKTQAYKNGEQFHYNIFDLQNSPSLMLHISSIYSP